MNKCFTLIIKKKWFDMEISRDKKDEYRKIKTYYTSRLCRIWCENYLHIKYKKSEQNNFINWLKSKGKIDFGSVLFINGYSAKSRRFIAECTLRIGTGRTEWGAELGEEYYVFGIKINGD